MRTQPLAMLISTTANYTLDETITIGGLGLDRLLRFVPPCTLTHVVWREFVEGPVGVPLWDPWRSQPTKGDPGPLVDPNVIVKALLGGAIISVARAGRHDTGREAVEWAADIRAAASRGALNSVRHLGAEIGRYAERLQRMATGLNTPRQGAP